MKNAIEKRIMKIKIDELDKLASEYVRKRAIQMAGGCERCLTPKYDIAKDNGSIFTAWKQLQCCHFYSRRRHSVRYDPDNLVGLCANCHSYFHSQPLEFVEFIKARLGEEKFAQLRLRAEGRGKIDRAAWVIYLKQLLKEVE